MSGDRVAAGEAWEAETSERRAGAIEWPTLAIPTGLVAREGRGQVTLDWHRVDGAAGYLVRRADTPDGPFAPIAAGLPNTGQYFWEYDPRSPRQIYLRLEVRDEAGNIAIDQLTEPIKVEGLEPKGRIRGFNPGPETSREAFRSPLFE